MVQIVFYIVQLFTGKALPVVVVIIWGLFFAIYLSLSMRLGCLAYERAYTRGKYQVGTSEYWSKTGAKVLVYYPID